MKFMRMMQFKLVFQRVLVAALFYLLTYSAAFANANNTHELATICKIWGFLKYHHPIVAKGKLDWDAELMKKLSTKESDEFSSAMIKWVKTIGVPDASYSVATNQPNENESLKWIDTDPLIDDSLRHLLWRVYHYRLQASSYYVKPFFVNGTVMFKNEKKYEGMDFSNVALRMLAVARYWNVINYFYPYLKLMDDDWNNVLPQTIDKMKAVSTRDGYINTLRWMVKQTCDGHNNFSVFYSFKRDSLMWTPYTYNVFEDKIKVDGYYSDSLSVQSVLEKGDEIIEIDNKSVSEHISYWKPYFNASNNGALLNRVSYFVATGYDSLVHLKVRRNGSLLEININRYREKTLISLQKRQQPLKDSVIDNIPYLNLEYVSAKEIEMFIKENFSAKAMIVDLRNYPKADAKVVFAKYMLSERKKFADIKLMDVSNPGFTRRMKKDSSIWDYSWIGSGNKNTYKGKVILLIDANTISHAEFTAMAMQVMPQVTVIGSQTGGANGNVTTFVLPGNFITSMSGIGVCYPNGAISQRSGIRLDVTIDKRSSTNLTSEDLIFNKALEYVKLENKNR